MLKITAPGRNYLSSLNNNDLEGGRVFRNSIKKSGAPGADSAGTGSESSSPGEPPNSRLENSNGEVKFYGDTGTEKHGNSTRTQSNVGVVSNSVRISCQTLQLSIEEFSENIRASNTLAAQNPEAHSEITTFLVELKEQIDQLIELLPVDNMSTTNSTVEKLSDWQTNVGITVHQKMQSYFTPEYIGENASPLIIVGIFTSVCAALTNALGLPPTTGAVVGGVTAATYVGKGKSVVKEME